MRCWFMAENENLLKVWTWSRFHDQDDDEISVFGSSFSTQYLIFTTFGCIEKLQSHRQCQNQTQNKAEDYDNLVVVCCFFFGRREHAHKQQFCRCYAAHAASTVFYYSPYYAAGSSTFPIVFMLLPCRIMLLDGVARCEFPAFSLYAFFCLVRIALKIFSFAALTKRNCAEVIKKKVSTGIRNVQKLP